MRRESRDAREDVKCVNPLVFRERFSGRLIFPHAEHLHLLQLQLLSFDEDVF